MGYLDNDGLEYYDSKLKSYVDIKISNGIAASDALIFKGSIGNNGTITALPTTYKTGWTYRVVTAGTYAGQVCEIGDLIIALVDRSGSNNADSDWCVAQTNINGAITGVKSGDAYITVSQSGSVVTITHKDVTRSNTTSAAAPVHGGTFTAVDGVTSDAKGHVTGVNTKTVTLPAQYSHPSYTARTGVPTANQTPAFGGTFTVTQPVSDATGHITAMNSRTITIPNAVATQSAAGLESAADKKKLDGIATGAEVNQNAFSNVVVGSTTVAADSKTDTLTLVAGLNVTITPDATNDKITIASTDTNTWRGIQDNLTSTSTTDSLTANQGKVLKGLIDEVKSLRATLNAYGLVKVTNSSAVTDSSGLALAATEKNATIPGTLANQVSQLNTDCNSILKPFFSNITLNKSNDWDSLALGFYGVNTYQSETGGNNYPIVSGADEHIIGLCINVKIAWDIQAQFVFGWNNSNTIYAYRIKGDEWQPWIYNFMENR